MNLRYLLSNTQSKSVSKLLQIIMMTMSIIICCGCVIALTSCNTNIDQLTNTVDYCTTANVDNMDFSYTDRDSSAKYADKVVSINLDQNISGDGVNQDGKIINLTEEATYVIKGTMNDGQICVDAKDAKMQIVLDGANITNNTGSAIFIKDCKKAFITTTTNSTNVISDTKNYADESEEAPNATIYSKEDLTLNGSGKLLVYGNYKHAIHSKDDLLVCGGTYKVESIEDAIRGKNCVKIQDGTFDIISGDAGIIATDKNEDNKGYLAIDNGKFTIKSGGNGIKAQTYSRINNGTITIASANDGLNSNVRTDINAGTINITATDDAIHAEAELNINDGTIKVEKCTEGFEAQVININGGTHTIFSTDDGINASAAEWDTSSTNNILNGQMPEDMQNFDPSQIPNNIGQEPQGNMQQPPSGNQQGDNMGGQGNMPQMPNGNQNNNMQGGSGGGFNQMPQGGMQEPPTGDQPQDQDTPQDMGGGGAFGYNENCKININNGTITIDSYGDGIDSNGDVTINGGTLLVNGPESGGNSALDFGDMGGSATVNGGTVLMLGSTGMAESFTGGSQPFNLSNASGIAGQKVSIQDANGTSLIELTSTKAFGCVLSSCSKFNTSSTYTIQVDGISTATFNPSTSKTQNQLGGGMNFLGNGSNQQGNFGQMPGNSQKNW